VTRAPLISVLIPARDAEATLPCSLASVAAQVERRWECIVVDDGSRDRTGDLARSVAGRDSRFRVVSTAPRGIVPALEAGFEECRGRYVARMDADDLMHRFRLTEQLELLESTPELAGAGCHVRFFPRRNLSSGLAAYERWLGSLASHEDVHRERFIECPLAHPSLFLRREVLERFPYRDPGWPEDYDLVLRVLASGEKLGVVPRVRHLWRDGPERLSRTGAAYRLEQFAACRAHYLARDFLRHTERFVLWGYGDTGRVLCRLLAAEGRTPTHIVELHPGRVGQIIRGARVIRPEELPSIPLARIVVSVAGIEARTLIRKWLGDMGRREGEDYVCAA
jgi:glycosyltransferase involved in cell wall biosynthesis